MKLTISLLKEEAARFAEIESIYDEPTRTLQDWEQGRRKPSGAAKALLTIAAKHPEVIREVVTA